MTSQTTDVSAVVARLENLERQNRRLKLAGVAVALPATADLLMGQAKKGNVARTVETEHFILKGTPRSPWCMYAQYRGHSCHYLV